MVDKSLLNDDLDFPGDELDLPGEPVNQTVVTKNSAEAPDFGGEDLDFGGEEIAQPAPTAEKRKPLGLKNDPYRLPGNPEFSTPGGRQVYDADNPPYDENAFIKNRKVVNGVEYSQHDGSGVISGPDGRVTVDEEVLRQFGKNAPTKTMSNAIEAQNRLDASPKIDPVLEKKLQEWDDANHVKIGERIFFRDEKGDIHESGNANWSPTKEQRSQVEKQFPAFTPRPSSVSPTYTGEATKGFFSGLADTVAMTLQGVAAARTSNPKAVKSLQADLQRFGEMPIEERENLRNGLFQRGINPIAAFQLRRALYQFHNGDVKRLEDSPEYQSAMELMNPQHLPDDALYAKGQEIMERAKKDFAAAPGWEQSLTRDVSAAGGSSGMFLGGGLVAKGLSKLPVVGPAAAELVGKGMSAVGLATAAGGQMQDAREWMKKNKIDPESDDAERIMLDAAVRGAPSGLSENVPIDFLVERGFSRFPFLRAFKNSSIKAKVGRTVGKMLLQAATEGGQEGLQQMYQNLQAVPYDKDRVATEGAGYSAFLGGIVGAGMQVPSSIIEEVTAGDAAPEFDPPQGRGTTTVNGTKWGYDQGQWVPLKNETAGGRADREPQQPRKEPKLFDDQVSQPGKKMEDRVPQTPDPTDVLKIFADAGISAADIQSMSRDQIRATVRDLVSQGAWPKGVPVPEALATQAPPPGMAPMAPRPNSGTPDANAGQQAADEPSAEPISDVKAQIADMQNPDSPRVAVFLSADAWNHAGPAVKGTKNAVVVENFDGKGGVLIARTKKIAQTAITNRDNGVPMQKILGEATGAGSGKPVDGTAVVQQVTKDGAVVRESLVTPETQAQTEKDFERPGHTVQVVTPEEAIKRRDEQVAADNQLPDFDGQPITSAGTRENPIDISSEQDLAAVRGQVNPEPTQGQKEAGNYKHAHVKLHGFDIGIESPKGGTRTGTDPDGKAWSATMPADYGKLKGYTGADGDEMDAYIGPDPKSPTVFIVHQKDLKSGKFDEHKVIFGTRSEEEATQLYEAGFSDGKGRDRMMQVEEVPVEQLEGWLESNQGEKLAELRKPASSTETPKGDSVTDKPDLNDTFDTLLDELAPEKAADTSTREDQDEKPSKDNEEGLPEGYDPLPDSKDINSENWPELVQKFGRLTIDGGVDNDVNWEQLGFEPSDLDRKAVSKVVKPGDTIAIHTGQHYTVRYLVDEVGEDGQVIGRRFREEVGGKVENKGKWSAHDLFFHDGNLYESGGWGNLGFVEVNGTARQDARKGQKQEDEKPSEPRVMGQNEGEVRTEDGEIMMVKLTPNGPWDFSDTYPQPILEQIEKMEKEGRNPFQGDDTRMWMTEEVVFTVEESLREMIDANLDAINAAQLRADLKSGKEKPAKGKTVEQAMADADKAIVTAKQSFEDIVGEYVFFSPEAVKAMKRMAKEASAKSQPRRPKAKRTVSYRPYTDAEMKKMVVDDDMSPAAVYEAALAKGATKEQARAESDRALATFDANRKEFLAKVETVRLKDPKRPQAVDWAAIHTYKLDNGKYVAGSDYQMPGHGGGGLPGIKDRESYDTIEAARDAMARKILKSVKDDTGAQAEAIRKWAREYLTKQEEKPTEQPAKPETPTTEQPKNPHLVIETGVVLRTKSGRETSPAPRIDGTTSRKLTVSLKNMENWLVDEAIKEAEAIKNNFVLTQFKAMKGRTLSQSDKDSVNFFLFENELGPTQKDVVRIEGKAEKPKKQTEKPAKVEEPKVEKPDLENLQDAGEKIGGARKDAWQVRGLRVSDLGQMNDAEKVKYTNKQNVWHKPDYADLVENKGMEPEAAYALKLLYDAIPVTPMTNGGVTNEEFIAGVDIVRSVLEPLRTVQQFKDLTAKMIDKAMQEAPTELAQHLGKDSYNLFSQTLAKPTKRRWRTKSYQFYLDSADWQKAKQEVGHGFPNAEPWSRFFFIRESVRDGKPIFHVYKRNGGYLKSYPTRDEAAAALKFAYETMEKVKSDTLPERPHLDNVTRTGPDYLKGRNITSEDFIKDFGFRAVEYGNWVAGDERQRIVNMAYESFHDLAWALGVNPKAMSLNGTLAIAFGSRGRGGKAAAHYESTRTVINLTKLTGAGTLAHEWGHAFDHYLGELYADKPYSGDPNSISGWRAVGKLPILKGHPANLSRAANELMKGLYQRKETMAEMETRLKREVETGMSSLDNWSAYLISQQAALQEKPDQKRHLASEIRKAKDAIEEWQRIVDRRKANLANPRPSMRKLDVESEFFKGAKALSGTGDYWIRGNEMFARSFEAFVFDTLAEKDRTSQYLVHSVESDRFGNGYRGNPYPSGQERDDINSLFSAFMDTIQLGDNDRMEGKPGPLVQRDEPNQEPIVFPAAPLDTSLDEAIAPEPDGESDGDILPVRVEDNVVEAFRDYLRDPNNRFETIVQARSFAEQQGFTAKSGTLEAKELEEKIELALVLLAREMHEAMVDAGKSPREVYDALVSLYDRQPRLATRTSTSMADQAYSTPVPLAYLVQNLAGITQESAVYEPTAGNGALVFTANPSLTIANELNDTRANHLRAQGFRTTQQDAAQSQQPEAIANVMPRDVVIGNPPFGVMKNEKNESIVYDVDGWQTTQIDHAIVMKSLKAMKKDGKAVFIVGSINEKNQARDRFHAYNQSQKRQFYFRLYQAYNVTDHFTVSGDLYQKQGAGWPVDIIVIDGAGKSKRALPAVNLPEILTTWDQVKEKLHGRIDGVRQPVREQAGQTDEGDGQLGGGSRPVGGNDGGRRRNSTRGAAAVTQEPGSMGPEPDNGSGRGIGEQQLAEPRPTGLEPEFVGDGGGPVEPSDSVNLENAFDNLLDDLLPEDAQPEPSSEPPTSETPPSSPQTTATPSPSSSTSTPGEKLASAAVNTVKGLDDVANGLFQLFHDPNKLGMGLNFDEDAYKKAKPLFEAAFEHFKDAAKDVVDAMRLLMKTLIEKYNFTREAMARMKPYVVRFIDETVAKKDLPKPGATPKVEEETEGQRTYAPKSTMNGLGTLVPANMQAAMQDALGAIERQYGKIDEWVAQELGYTQDELREALSAEQVDAVAMGLDQVKQGKAFILGDQTGIGKGRVVAAMLRYALRNGLSPVFVTHKPNLYGDIIRDLKDIGIEKMLGREPRVFMTNQGEEVPLDDEAVAWFDEKEQAKLDGVKSPARRGNFIKSPSGAAYKKALEQIVADQGVGPDKTYDIIATTYNQMQTVKGGETERRNLMRRIAPNSFIVMDESHNAGGTGGEDRGPKTKKDGTPIAPDASKFFREIIKITQSVLFSSATYAKRPEVMDLYARTDMGLAVDDAKKLGALIEAGGVPMQQVVASMLTEAGQYIRRERSFAGITYDVRPVDVDTEAYTAFSHTMRAVYDFDKELKGSDWWEGAIENALAAAGMSVSGKDNAVGEASVTSSTFSSIMHNMVNQMLLGIKIDAVADMAIAEIKAGRKPVVTVSGTMGAFIQQVVEDEGLKPGQSFNRSFRDVAKRYLKRTMRITVKDADDNKHHIQIEPEALPADLRSIYDAALDVIEGMSDENIPLSPIDWLRHKIEKAGYNVGEITGRKHVMRYSGKNMATYAQRTDGEISIAGRRSTLSRFNEEEGSGREIHLLILNRAGSTGLSAHAYFKFKNKRPRVMLIAQAEGNIDDHMQLLGRINRTGQVVLPSYIQAYADIPAEARPAAVLAKKMASLNANTTASRKGALSSDEVDFINQYGDEVVMNLLIANPELQDATGVEVGENTNKADMAVKFTGKLTLLPPDTQREVLDAITENYKALLQEKDALGENALEAKTLDLQAVTTEALEMRPPSGTSPFQQAVMLETLEVKSEGKAMPLEEVRDTVALESGMTPKPDVGVVEQLQDMEARSKDQPNREFLSKSYKDGQKHIEESTKSMRDPEKKKAKQEELWQDLKRWGDIVNLSLPGRRVVVETNSFGRLVGVAMKIERRSTGGKGGGNPTALGAWSVTIALPDNSVMLKVPFHSIALAEDPDPKSGTQEQQKKAESRKIGLYAPQWDQKWDRVAQSFEEARLSGKETRFMFTGNILGGYELARGGQIVNYTNDKGEVRPGVLMPKMFKKESFLDSRPVEFTNAKQIAAFLKADDDMVVSSTDMLISIRWSYRNGFVFEVNPGRNTGGKYFLNDAVRNLTNNGFVKRGAFMTYSEFSDQRFPQIVNALVSAGARFASKANQDIALKAVEDNPDNAATLFQKPIAEKPVGKKSDNEAFKTLTPEKKAAVEKAMQDAAVAILGHRIKLAMDDNLGSNWGQFDPNSQTIFVSSASENFIETVGHEALHALRDLGVFTKAEWQLLKEAAAKFKYNGTKIADLVHRFYDEDYRKTFDLTEEQHQEVLQEEAVAFMIGAHVAGTGGIEPASRVSKIIEKFVQFLEAVHNLARGYGFKTAKGVVRDIMSGAMKNREIKTPGRGYYMKGRETEESSLNQRIMPKSQPNRPVTFQEPEDMASAIWNSNQPLLTRMTGALEAAFLPMRRQLQDNMQDWKRVEDAIQTQTGNPINPALRVYQAETLYAGRTGERLEDLRMDDLEPLADEMKRLGVTIDMLDDFLTARHAPERNAYIASINPNMPDGGSGMMNAAAQGVIAGFQNQGKLQALQRIAQRIDKLVTDSRRNLLNGGVIDQQTFNQWSQQYQHYVPLRGDPNENDAFGDSILGAGRKFDTRNKVSHAALGRRSRSESPTAWAIAQIQQSIVLSEKARVGRAALRLARRFPNKNIWEVGQAVPKRTLSKATGLVVSYMDHRAKTQADNVLAVREGGNLYYLTLHHPGMAQAMKNLEGVATPAILRIFQSLQRYYAMMRTGLDPQFFIPNFLRDVQTAGVHISADQGAKILAETLRDIPKAMRGVWRGERGKLNTQWAQIYRDFGQAGGKVGVFGLESIEDIKAKIERDIALMKGGAIATPYKWGRETVQFMMDINSAVENAVRVSLYAAMRRNGYSRDDAAFAAKEVTVNFNRKGNASKYINAAYVFFNASVQGTARVAMALAKSKTVRRVALGLFVAGILQDIMNSWMSGDSDDDGENDYDQIPEWLRERNYIVMLPWDSDQGGRAQIPMPWVYNVFHYAGTNVGRALRGKIGSTEAAANVFGALVDAMNPIQSNSLAQTLTPTLLDPAIELYANKDWKGDPIMPEQNKHEAPKPDSQLYWESVNPTFKEASQIMNDMSGGDSIRPGAIDISPETLEYIGEFLGGGVVATYNQILSTAGKAWRGEEIDAERVPFLRKVYGTHSSTQGRNEYYTMREAVKLTETQFENAVKEGKQDTIQLIREQYSADIKAVSLFKETDKVLTELRNARKATADGEKRQMIQGQMDKIMARARKAYRKLQDGSGSP